MDPFMSEMASRAGGSAIAKVGTSIIEKLAGKAADVIKDRLTQVDLWSEYERRYIDRYGKVKLTLSGMREAVPLEQIYTGVCFLDDLSIGWFTSIESLEKGFREKPRRFQRQNCRTQDGIAVANEHPYLMVLGSPGAGKSTYLRRIGLEALKDNQSKFQHELIPVMLELKQFDGELVDWKALKTAITEEFSNVGFDFSMEFVEEALKQGKLLILLDGLDEVPKNNQDKVVQAIQDFVSRYNRKHQGNRVIASCRVAAFRSGFANFTDIELADFNDEQIRQFIENWFHSALDQATKTAKKCWNSLNESSYKSAKELAQTPLLLTFLCVVYERTQSFPANRAALYRKALDILLEEWAAEKRIRHEPIYEGLNTELEKVLLAEIAYRGFIENRLFFIREELIGHIQKFLEDSAEKSKYLDGKAVLTAIAVQQGILVERAEDIYSFSHLTVQEYLTAQYLSQDQTALSEAVSRHLTEKRWREVFLLVPGLLPNADSLLKSMENIAQQRVHSPKLQALLGWTNRVTVDSANPAAAPAKRILVLFFAFAFAHDNAQDCARYLAGALDLDDAIESASDNFDLVIDIANHRDEYNIASDLDLALRNLTYSADDIVYDLDLILAKDILNRSINVSAMIQGVEALKLQVPNDEQPLNARQAFAEQLLQIWYEGLGLEQELINFPEDEVALADYFYICELMVRCKESAVRVSREVWESIENAMVMPTPENGL
jgi:NACHT domain